MWWNLLKFYRLKHLLGFDVANQFIQRVDRRSLQLILKKNGARLGKNCDIETGLIFHNCHDYSNLIIGDNSHIGKHCFFDLKEKIYIGNNSVISMRCTFITHTDMGKSSLSQIYSPKALAIWIDDHVFVGADVTVLMGVRINPHAIVAAKSLVKDNVDRATLVAGIPCRPIKTEIRYS